MVARHGSKSRLSNSKTPWVMVSLIALILVAAASYSVLSPSNKTSTSTTTSTQQATGKTGLIIPLYTSPSGSSWAAVETAKQDYPAVPMEAVINPDSGPCVNMVCSANSAWVTGIAALHASGVVVLGYIPTEYASVAASTVEQEMSEYHSWYDVQGFFFDEASNVAGNAPYYATLTQYAQSIGLSITVANPGALVPSSYLGSTTSIVIHEDLGVPSASALSSDTGLSGSTPKDWAVIAYGVTSLDTAWISANAPTIGWMYMTDACPNGSGGCNPYGQLATYFTAEVQALNSYNTA